MKHCNRGGFVQTYDPKAKEKKSIRLLLNAYAGSPSLDYPRISFLFHMPIPLSIRKKDQDLYASGKLKHDKKPDVDNLIKLYLDCLDGIVLEGDQKVSLGPCLKVYHPEPKTIIWLSETARTLDPWEMDNVFLDASESEIQSFCAPDFPHDSYSLYRQVLALSLRRNSPSGTIPSLEPPGRPQSPPV